MWHFDGWGSLAWGRVEAALYSHLSCARTIHKHSLPLLYSPSQHQLQHLPSPSLAFLPPALSKRRESKALPFLRPMTYDPSFYVGTDHVHLSHCPSCPLCPILINPFPHPPVHYLCFPYRPDHACLDCSSALGRRPSHPAYPPFVRLAPRCSPYPARPAQHDVLAARFPAGMAVHPQDGLQRLHPGHEVPSQGEQ